MWNQGQSGVLNEKILGNDRKSPLDEKHRPKLTSPSLLGGPLARPHPPDQPQAGRDAPTTRRHRPQYGRRPTVSRHIPSPNTSLPRTSTKKRNSALAALTHPRLFHTLCLLDPVIQIANAGISPASASTFRRDIWDSRAAAAEKFAQSKFYQAWDPRVLDAWIRHGLRDVPTELYPAQGPNDERVTLTTSKHQELFTFLRPTYRTESEDGFGYEYGDRDPVFDASNPPGYPFYRFEPLHIARRLPELKPSVLYVFGETSDISVPESRKDKMERTGAGLGGSGGAKSGRVKEVLLDCGHLVAMERVGGCADAVAGWLEGELGRWKEERAKQEEGRRGRERREVIMVDGRWKREIKPRVVKGSKI